MLDLQGDFTTRRGANAASPSLHRSVPGCVVSHLTNEIPILCIEIIVCQTSLHERAFNELFAYPPSSRDSCLVPRSIAFSATHLHGCRVAWAQHDSVHTGGDRHYSADRRDACATLTDPVLDLSGSRDHDLVLAARGCTSDCLGRERSHRLPEAGLGGGLIGALEFSSGANT